MYPIDSLRPILWPKQADAVDRIVQKRRILLADEPGTGKTLMSMAALEASNAFNDGPTLILAPNTPAALTWIPHFQRFLPHIQFLDLVSGTRVKKAERLAERLHEPNLVVIGNHNVINVKNGVPAVPGLHDIKFKHFVLDEAHEVLPTAHDVSSRMTQFWQGLNLLYRHFSGIVLPMTGTPDRSRLWNRYGYWKLLMPDVFTNYWEWVEDNFVVSTKRIRRFDPRRGQTIVREIPEIGSLKEVTRWKALDETFVIRRTKAEIREGRPMKHVLPIPIRLSLTQSKNYRRFRDMFMAGEFEDMSPAIWALRARQLASVGQWDILEGNQAVPVLSAPSAKFDWLVNQYLMERAYFDADWVPDPEHPEKVVITFAYNSVLRYVQQRLADLGIRAEAIVGGQDAQNRAIVEEFQDANSQLRIVLLQHQVGRGIDLDMADDLIHFELPYDSDITEQVEDRIDRLSRDHKVTIYWLLAQGTIDYAIAEDNQTRFETTRELLDGVRGLAHERRMLDKLRNAPLADINTIK